MKMTDRARLSAAEVIRVTAEHARNHGGRALFTTGRGPGVQMRDRVARVLLLTRDGRTALIANVHGLGTQFVDGEPTGLKPAPEFEQPSVFPPDDATFFYELDHVKLISVKRGQYRGSDGRDVLDLLSNRATMAYVDEVQPPASGPAGKV